MSKHSVVEAKNQLSALIERALKGERVVITRHGHPVVEIVPSYDDHARMLSAASLDRLESLAVKPLKPGQDAGELLSEMRDEWSR
jgi:prevent-host-death family protein